jgi:hypothetical protein
MSDRHTTNYFCPTQTFYQDKQTQQHYNGLQIPSSKPVHPTINRHRTTKKK